MLIHNYATGKATLDSFCLQDWMCDVYEHLTFIQQASEWSSCWSFIPTQPWSLLGPLKGNNCSSGQRSGHHKVWAWWVGMGVQVMAVTHDSLQRDVRSCDEYKVKETWTYLRIKTFWYLSFQLPSFHHHRASPWVHWSPCSAKSWYPAQHPSKAHSKIWT